MNKQTASIWFVIMGIVIILISLKTQIVIPLMIGLIVIIQGIYTFLKK